MHHMLPFVGLAAALIAGGGPAYVINLTNQTIEDSVLNPSSAYAEYTLQTGGQAISSGFGNIPNEWTNPVTSGQGALFEVRATLVSGSLSSGTTGTWLALSSTRTWTRTRALIGTSQAVLTIEIRDVATQTIQDSCTVTLTATVEF